MRAMFRRLTATAVTLAVGLALTGCAAPTDSAKDGRLRIYATTGYLADAATRIAPDAEITTMVGPGGDPHTYQPSTRDIERIHDADLVLWNGLHLEAQIADQLASLGDQQLPVGDLLPREMLIPLPETGKDGEPLYDPHIWNSPEAWRFVIELITNKLVSLDPGHEATYRARAGEFALEIEEAESYASELLAGVPLPRILITGHDAFAYFGQTFDLDVRATDFISTEAALSATDLSRLAALIAQERVPAIFRDNQANPQAITSLREAVQARGWSVEVSDAELYADSLGAEPDVSTYLGVLRHNARTIATALGGAA